MFFPITCDNRYRILLSIISLKFNRPCLMVSFSGPNLGTRPAYSPEPESILACLLAAASSIFSLGIPEATAFAIPPISSI